MEHLAEMLLAECDSIRDEYGGGTLKHFEQAVGDGVRSAVQGNGPFGGWQSAMVVNAAHAQLYAYTHKLYDQVVRQLEAAAQALKRAADGYRNADHTTLAGLSPVSGMTATPSPQRPAAASHSAAFGPAGSHSSSGQHAGSGTSGGGAKATKTTDFEELG